MNQPDIFDGENLNAGNREELNGVRRRYYMAPLLNLYEAKVMEIGLPQAANHLSEVMRAGQGIVEKLLVARRDAGKIKSVDQTRKNIAGNGFQGLVFCALASLQSAGLIPADLVFTLRTGAGSRIGETVISVGPETIKPDVDLLVYSSERDDAPICMYSLKTSLRERAGQTHRWRILLDIVTADNCHSIKEKYDLQYSGFTNLKMAMITTNFYSEITSPQQRGLLRFFDYVYLTKPDAVNEPVTQFSNIAQDLVGIYG